MNTNIVIKEHKRDGLLGERLSRLHDAPQNLFYKGVDPQTLLHRPLVAIVGSRKMSAYGKVVTQQLANDLIARGCVIVSGLALGVDAAAQQVAVQLGAPTIAVLAGGLDTVHPMSHSRLAADIIIAGGSLISEYSVGMPPMAHQFIARNRIIAAISDAVMVTEAAHKSGSLHTAGFALDLGKPVLAVPGPITSPLSAGTNGLLKTGALLATQAHDVLDALYIPSHTAKITQQSLFYDATPQQQAVIHVLQDQGVVEGWQLQQSSKLDAAAYAEALTMLEISGIVKPLGADNWQLA
jgi:DNA processing protein